MMINAGTRSRYEESCKVVPDLPELIFEEKTHTYKLNGIIIPSVTTIMAPLTAYKYDGISDAILDNAANKGTAVHNAIENYIKYGIEDVPPEFHGYFDGFLDWWNKNEVVVVESEAKIYHKILRYGGTVDILAYVNGELALIDIKTTYEMCEKTFGVQLEAYSQALKSHGVNVTKKYILHLKKDGKCVPKEFPVNDAIRWRVFGSLKNIYDYQKSA